ncbi:MAG: alpha/beta hydrolase [Anaerolineaceae bacterium]|nr:alpha/beta hydrolase [Anaerolineaceae bacterium]
MTDANMYVQDPNPQGGLPVVLLHGLGATSSCWGYQVPALVAAGMRPVAPDLPGFGQSPFTGRRWNVRYVTRQLVETLSARLDGQKAVVAGISMGGVFALQLAVDYPEMVESLVLVNTFACLRPRRWNDLRYLLIRFVKASLMGAPAQTEMVAQRLFPGPEQEEMRQIFLSQAAQSDRRVYRAAMRTLALIDLRRSLPTIRAKTLVVSGARDNTVGLVVQEELAERIPGARQTIISNAGHAVIAEQPDLFNQALLDFLVE